LPYPRGAPAFRATFLNFTAAGWSRAHSPWMIRWHRLVRDYEKRLDVSEA
jgi:hypothetical protein